MAARLQDADGGVQKAVHRSRRAIENARLEVFAYASRHGYTLIDREIYLARCWSDDGPGARRQGYPNMCCSP